MVVTSAMSSKSQPALLHIGIGGKSASLSGRVAISSRPSGRLNQIRQQSEGAGNQLIQLMVQHECYMGMAPQPDVGRNERALERTFSRIVEGKKFFIGRIVFCREVEAPFLIPTLPIVRLDLVRIRQQ